MQFLFVYPLRCVLTKSARVSHNLCKKKNKKKNTQTFISTFDGTNPITGKDMQLRSFTPIMASVSKDCGFFVLHNVIEVTFQFNP